MIVVLARIWSMTMSTRPGATRATWGMSATSTRMVLDAPGSLAPVGAADMP